MAQDPTTTAPRSTAAWKAVAAAGIGVALLAAGGATFAEWSDSEDAATGTRITAGVLDLEGGAGTWTNAGGDDVTADIEDGSYRVVPGDALQRGAHHRRPRRPPAGHRLPRPERPHR